MHGSIIYIYIIYIVKFPPVDEDMIKKTAIEAKGWQRVTLSDQSRTANKDLWKLFGEIISLVQEIHRNKLLKLFCHPLL